MAQDDVPAGPPLDAAAPAVKGRSPWVVLGALFGAILCADHWATAHSATPLAKFLEDQAQAIGLFLLVFVLPGVLVGKNPLPDVRNLVLPWAPTYLVGLVPTIVSLTGEWDGGRLLAIAGAALGAPAGALLGWMFTRWTLPDLADQQPQPARAARLPIAFAVLFALYGGSNWGIHWITPDAAWVIPVVWICLALPGALVGRPLVGLRVMSPFVVVTMVPLVALLTVGWEGGWIPGIAGALVGAAAGAVTGWMFLRSIMPEYDKRRARDAAARGSGGSPANPYAERSVCPTCSIPLKEKGSYLCKCCGTIFWDNTVAVLVVLVLFIGLASAVALLGYYGTAWTVVSWIIFVVGVGFLFFCLIALCLMVNEIGEAKELAAWWKRNDLTRTEENGQDPDVQDHPG